VFTTIPRFTPKFDRTTVSRYIGAANILSLPIFLIVFRLRMII
jgi:hypothetical protein